jgi:hypothetical protein
MRVPSLLAASAACVLASCYIYSPHSYVDLVTPFPGARVDLGGCLDLAVTYTEDALAHGQVVGYTFGNRCYHRVIVDLAAVRAVEYVGGGEYRPLRPYDPNHELAPLPIEALWQGHEQIEYDTPSATVDWPTAKVCVDVGGVDGSAPRRARWVCLGSSVQDALPPGGPA